MGLIKGLFFTIDRFVYWVAKGCYSVFCTIANIDLLDTSTITSFNRKVYAIIGIFMVFVLAWSLITYIINPDKISDSKQGASSILKDVLIALVIIVITPAVFTKLYSFQYNVITSNIISGLVFGGSTASETEIEGGANAMVANVFSAFMHPDDENFSVFSDCAQEDWNSNWNATEKTYSEYNDYCLSYSQTLIDGKIENFADFYKNDEYRYTPIFSTAGGVVLAIFMLGYCINLGKRAGKLFLLELIAPIPCLLEILPNKKGTRKGWLSEIGKVYIEVFIYQFVVFVMILLISLIPTALKGALTNLPDSVPSVTEIIAYCILIFGLLQFGKEAPKMILDLLGIKSTGLITGSFKSGMAMGGVFGGLLGSSAGRFARGIATSYDKNDKAGSIRKGVLNGMAASGSGLIRNVWGARNVNSLKDANALRRNINTKLVNNQIERQRYAEEANNEGHSYIGQHARDVGRKIAGVASEWATGIPTGPMGSNKSALQKRLEDLDELSKDFGNIKPKTSDDKIYSRYQSQYNDILAKNGISVTDFNANVTEQEIVNGTSRVGAYLSRQGLSPYKVQSITADLKNYKTAMNDRENEMKISSANKDKIRIMAAKYKNKIKNSKDLETLVSSNAININALDLDSNSSDAEFKAAFEALKELNKSGGKLKTDIQVNLASMNTREIPPRNNQNNGSK